MSIIESLRYGERKQPYLGCIKPEQVSNEENYQRKPIVPGNDYFEVRIPETFLRFERAYWKRYAPITVIMLRFLHDGKIRELPFTISSQTLLASFPNDAKNWTEFYNTRVFRPFPYEGGDVELAIALYAVETQNKAKEMFSLLDSLLSLFQAPLASQALQTADTITHLIEKFIGLSMVSRKLSYYQAFQEGSDLPNSFRDQYLIRINADENKITKDKLWVRDGRLHTKLPSGKFQRASEWDYCLTRIHASEKTQYTQLPFWKTWKSVRRYITNGNQNMAHNVYAELIRQVTLCTDLTERDRRNLPFLIKAKYESEVGRFNQLNYSSRDTPRYRSAGRGTISGALGLEQAALTVRRMNFPSQIHQGLKQLSMKWDNIPKLNLVDNGEDRSDELISQQLDYVRTFVSTDGLTPAEIADALTLAVK